LAPGFVVAELADTRDFLAPQANKHFQFLGRIERWIFASFDHVDYFEEEAGLAVLDPVMRKPRIAMLYFRQPMPGL
jgi:hypothetical protein